MLECSLTSHLNKQTRASPSSNFRDAARRHSLALQRQSTSFRAQLSNLHSKFGGAASFGASFKHLYCRGDRGIQPIHFLNS